MATLRELRTNKGHAQNAVAKAIGVSKAAMSAYEVGKRRLPIVRARALAEALGCSIDEVVAAAEASARADQSA
jgi:transcriptional regulator with XRE-family HTH domain